MRKNILLLVFVASLCAAGARGQAANVFVTQSGAGTQDGSSLANALPITALSNSGNCGGLIGQDTVVHISVNSSGSAGTANFPVNTQIFAFRCDGTSGHPVTVQFKSGDTWQSPAFSGQSAFYFSGRSFIVIDLNGVLIQDTLNGHTGGGNPVTPPANCPAGPCTTHQTSALFQMLSCNTCEIKGPGTLANTYVTVQCENGGAPGAGECGVTGDAQQNAIQFGGPNFKIHDLTAHDNTWAMLENASVGDTNIQIYNNDIYHMDHGIACGAGPGVTINTFFIHDNHFHDMQNFDSGADDSNHHDGIHCFSTYNSGKIQNIYIYNNIFDGQQGLCCVTAWIFLEGGFGAGRTPWTDTTGTAYIWNNIFSGSIDSGNGQLSVNAGTGHKIFNNVIQNTGPENGGICFNARGAAGTEAISFENNILRGCSYAFTLDNQVALTTWDNNAYENFGGGGNEIFNWTGHTSGSTNSLSAWKTICGCDAAAKGGTSAGLLNVNSVGIPQTGSIVINAGVNLTGQATGLLASLQNDTTAGNSRMPTARPSSGNWTIGAYSFGSSPPPPPPPGPPPILLGVTVSHFLREVDWQEAR